MYDVVLIKGNVNHAITLDPSVWIFDDRKRKLNDFFSLPQLEEDESLAYQRDIGSQWDRELKEGAATPTIESEKLFIHKKDISGDWGMKLRPFLTNAGPKEDAQSVICHLQTGEQVELDLQDAMESILCFALDGRPIREQGPVHLFLGDGSNRENPIIGIIAFEVK